MLAGRGRCTYVENCTAAVAVLYDDDDPCKLCVHAGRADPGIALQRSASERFMVGGKKTYTHTHTRENDGHDVSSSSVL